MNTSWFLVMLHAVQLFTDIPCAGAGPGQSLHPSQTMWALKAAQPLQPSRRHILRMNSMMKLTRWGWAAGDGFGLLLAFVPSCQHRYCQQILVMPHGVLMNHGCAQMVSVSIMDVQYILKGVL